MNSLQLLNALSVEGTSKGLSYVQVEMNRNGVEVMLDTGAAHKFVADYGPTTWSESEQVSK